MMGLTVSIFMRFVTVGPRIRKSVIPRQFSCSRLYCMVWGSVYTVIQAVPSGGALRRCPQAVPSGGALRRCPQAVLTIPAIPWSIPIT